MRIDVWSDVVCPWCWLGKARLEKAIAAFPQKTEVVFHSFELDPRAPKDLDIPTSELVAKKYGMGKAQLDALQQRLARLGADDGLEFHFDKTRTSNTFDAHQLVHFARAEGKDLAMADRLFLAQFRDGVRVGERAELVRLAGEVGLDPSEAQAALDEQRFASAVREDEAEARSLGITGVPFFLAAGKVGVSGAQSVEVLTELLTKGWEHRGAAAAEACGDDGCPV